MSNISEKVLKERNSSLLCCCVSETLLAQAKFACVRGESRICQRGGITTAVEDAKIFA